MAVDLGSRAGCITRDGLYDDRDQRMTMSLSLRLRHALNTTEICVAHPFHSWSLRGVVNSLICHIEDFRRGATLDLTEHGTPARPQVCRMTYPEFTGRLTKEDSHRAMNMEDNEETALLSDQDSDSWRRPWQHNNVAIRLSSRFLRHLWLNPQLVWYLVTIALCGELVRQILEGRFSSLTVLICSMNIICLATYSRFQSEEGDGPV